MTSKNVHVFKSCIHKAFQDAMQNGADFPSSEVRKAVGVFSLKVMINMKKYEAWVDLVRRNVQSFFKNWQIRAKFNE
jgi:hypothetical protein